MNIAKIIRKNLVNLPGWRTKRKIVVIESDDWGSVRIPSREIYNLFLSKGIPVDSYYMTKYDCLESDDDLLNLFEILSLFSDKNGASPVITANTVVANPDFERISGFKKKEYYYELITDTYKKYPNHKSVMQLWKDNGIGKRMLWPQFHGREHLNVRYWMKTINGKAFSENLAFDNKSLLGLFVPGEPVQNYNYMAAFEYDFIDHMNEIELITREGLNLFEKIFGFKSKSFIASCAVQGEHIDIILKNGGVHFHQSGQQFRPLGGGKYKVINRFWGQNNKEGQIYWRRNCTFEPSRNHSFDWVDSCLAEMNIAFNWGKPAVINSHRVNYIGSIFPENRDKSLRSLKKLIDTSLHIWPDLEFMTSDELGDLIIQSKR